MVIATISYTAVLTSPVACVWTKAFYTCFMVVTTSLFVWIRSKNNMHEHELEMERERTKQWKMAVQEGKKAERMP